ncbi:MAG: hypothetical protein HYV09_34145 [Deltaproteobacteria bacterium]|nr:hypothetical protein [Deltaproteobacteria bacterium]
MRNMLIMGWKGSKTGREAISAAHFQEVVAFLGSQQREKRIEAWEPIFMDPHGATLQGFFLIRGSTAQLDALQNNEAWQEHVTRAILHLEDVVHARATGGDQVPNLMQRWTKYIPKT